jgi:hypothetical protein
VKDIMDRNQTAANSAPGKAPSRWAFLPHSMPRVAKLLAEKRAKLGAEHVALCWQKGVVECEPGWFYAREGALAVGVPFDDLETVYAATPRAQQVLLFVRDPAAKQGGSTDGAH